MAGAFGNPLSAGIALQMDTNKIFNDERQLRLAEDKLKMSKEAARAGQRKKDEKELAGILGKITSDDSKVWWRYQDDAKNSYANTIRDVSNAWKSGDYNSAYTKMNDHNVKMTGLVQATKLKDDWITRSMKGDVYTDNEFLKALEDRNVPMTSLAQMGHGYGMFNDDSGTLGFSPLTQIMSVDNVMADALKASSQTIRRDPQTGETMITGSVGAGLNKQDQYMTQKGDREGAIASVLNAYGTDMAKKQGEIQRRKGWDYLESLDKKITNPSDLAEVNKVLNEELAILAGESYDKQAYEEKILGKPTQPRVDKDPPETSTSIQLSGGDTSLTVQSQKASSEMRVKAIDNTFSNLPTEEEDGVESTDYSLQGFEGSAVQRRLEAMGFVTKTEPVPFPGATDNLYISKGDKKAKYDLDENVYTNLRSFVDENAGDVLKDNPLEIINLPRDAQHVISQTKATEAQNKINLLPIKNAIVVGADGMDYMALTNNIDLRGQVSEVYDYIDIDFENISKLKDGEEGDPGYSFYDASVKDNIKEGRKRYYKIIPGGSIEGGTSTDREFNDVIGKQTGKGTGYEASRTGAIEYILVEETPELKSRFESNYKLDPNALNPFEKK